ncbi:hypothetical protein OAU44_00395 [bacterium]|nr:hypothetical protein [bacterium]
MYGISDSFDSVSERFEKFLSWKDHSATFSHKGVEIGSENNVCGVLENVETGYTTYNWAQNIVGDDGDIYYAKKSAGESTTSPANENFLAGRAELQTGNVTSPAPAKGDTFQQVLVPIAASIKTLEANYPKTYDASANSAENPTGYIDAVTYKYYWNTGAFSANGITGGCIHDNATPVNATKLLTHWAFAASFSKTSTDTLTLYVNHKMNGI